MSMDRQNTKRQFPRTTDIARDLGGIYTSLMLVFSFVVGKMSLARLNAIITSALFKQEKLDNNEIY